MAFSQVLQGGTQMVKPDVLTQGACTHVHSHVPAPPWHLRVPGHAAALHGVNMGLFVCRG